MKICIRLGIVIVFLAETLQLLPQSQRFMWYAGNDDNMHVIDLLQLELEDAPVPDFDGENDVKLNLYTQNNPSTPEIILISNASSAPSFNPKHPTRFVLHGWTSSAVRMDVIRKAYMDTGLDFNVVMVDWERLADHIYSASKRNSRRVGEWVAEVIAHLETKRGLNLDDVYIIGHSLGAQASGVAGNRLHGQVAQVIGLDAAAPLFRVTSLENRLDSSDAKQVQGIHTNGGVLGWKEPLGHIDFFPGGGSNQVGCVFDFSGACSHNKAVLFYAESIENEDFLGTMCHSFFAYTDGNCSGNAKQVMGQWAPLKVTGTYYLKTSCSSPYSLGDVGL